jgi:hypothetical protein
MFIEETNGMGKMWRGAFRAMFIEEKGGLNGKNNRN